MPNKMIAAVRVRGALKAGEDIMRTFSQLNLHNKNWCVVLEDNPVNLGMLRKVKDYITWGEISEEVLDKLVAGRGEETKDDKNFFAYKKKKFKRYFRLNPPVKGYGRKGVKVSFKEGGALGYRDKMSELLERMV